LLQLQQVVNMPKSSIVLLEIHWPNCFSKKIPLFFKFEKSFENRIHLFWFE